MCHVGGAALENRLSRYCRMTEIRCRTSYASLMLWTTIRVEHCDSRSVYLCFAAAIDVLSRFWPGSAEQLDRKRQEAKSNADSTHVAS